MTIDRPAPLVQGWRRAAVPAAWLVALASLAMMRGVEPAGAWLPWAAALLSLAAALLALRVLVAGVPPALRHQLPLVLVLGGAPWFMLVAASGGVTSPAALAAGPVALGIGWRLGVSRAAASAGAAVLLLLIADLALVGTVRLPQLLAVGLAIAAIGVAPLWHARRLATTGMEARRRLARVEGYLAERRMTPHGSRAVGSDLRGDAEVVQQHAEGLTHLAELDRFLRDVRDALGAEEAILWRWHEARGTQLPLSWSTEGADTPRHFRYEDWAPQVKWTAEEGTTHAVVQDGRTRFVSAAVERRGTLYGALSVSATDGLELPEPQVREWVERHAMHAALLAELFEVRREYGKVSRHAFALHHASTRIRPSLDVAELGRAICDTALQITSGTRASLVRWEPASNAGRLESVSRAHPMREQFALSPESLIAAQCRSGEPALKADARQFSRRHPVYGAGEPKREIGSIAVAPFRRETGTEGERPEPETFGALVVESDTPDALTHGELRNLSLLGTIAATSLQVSWEIEEVSRRARTDALTGLANRRHFDDELARLLESSDRHGQPAALIVADIDHFKRINDTWGHDAGDTVLRHVARVFLDVIRGIDLCARYGGEEIVVLLPQTRLAGAVEVAERLRRALELRPAPFRGDTIVVTCSVGVAAYPQCTTRRDGLFAAADRALYDAKQNGRNQVKAAVEVHVPA